MSVAHCTPKKYSNYKGDASTPSSSVPTVPQVVAKAVGYFLRFLYKHLLIVLGAVCVLFLIGFTFWLIGYHNNESFIGKNRELLLRLSIFITCMTPVVVMIIGIRTDERGISQHDKDRIIKHLDGISEPIPSERMTKPPRYNEYGYRVTE